MADRLQQRVWGDETESSPLLILCSVAAGLEPSPDVLRLAKRKSQYRQGGCFVGAVEKDAGIAGVEIGHIVGLTEAVGDKVSRIIPHATGSRLVQAPARRFRLSVPLIDGAGVVKNLRAGLLGMFPHFERVLVPLKVKSHLWCAEDIFLYRVDIYEIPVRSL